MKAIQKSEIKKPRSARGSALVAVLSMFLLISAAIASITILFATENRRTQVATSGAQLDELLLAATPIAAEELRLHGSATREVAFSTPVDSGKLTLSITSISEQKVQVRVVAAVARGSASQTLTFFHTPNTPWRLQSAELGSH